MRRLLREESESDNGEFMFRENKEEKVMEKGSNQGAGNAGATYRGDATLLRYKPVSVNIFELWAESCFI